jgi:hypothetical protein
VHSVRTAVGIRHAEPALVRLPSPGRLLVDSAAGSWIVDADGSKRLLGRYAASAWSPHGLFELVTRGHELAALDPKGVVRWSLERAGAVRDARWSPDGYRVAYRAGRSLRVAAGDGTGDRLLAAAAAPVAPAWQPGGGHVLAYVTPAGTIRTVDADTGREVASRRARSRPLLLLWSPDGSRLLGVGRDTIDVRTAALALVQAQVLQHGTIAAAAWAPRGRRYAFVVHDARRDRSAVVVQGEAETPFQGTGRVDGLVWSPDGRWLLLAWRTADEWVFAPAGGGERIRAVGSISAQFHSASFPRLAGWCC